MKLTDIKGEEPFLVGNSQSLTYFLLCWTENRFIRILGSNDKGFNGKVLLSLALHTVSFLGTQHCWQCKSGSPKALVPHTTVAPWPLLVLILLLSATRECIRNRDLCGSWFCSPGVWGEALFWVICSVHGKALPVNSWKWRASHGDTEQGRYNSMKLHTCVHRIVIFSSRRRTQSFWQILKEVSSPERDA